MLGARLGFISRAAARNEMPRRLLRCAAPGNDFTPWPRRCWVTAHFLDATDIRRLRGRSAAMQDARFRVMSCLAGRSAAAGDMLRRFLNETISSFHRAARLFLFARALHGHIGRARGARRQPPAVACSVPAPRFLCRDA